MAFPSAGQPAQQQQQPDHYNVLKIPRTASIATIKAAYHAAARLHHPDKQTNGAMMDNGTDETFIPIQAAWECLGNHLRRQEYDVAWDRIRKQRESRRRNAVEVTWDDCCYASNGGEQDVQQEVLLYTCRCGQRIDLCEEEEEEEEDGIVSCPSCSLLYDVSRIFTADDAEEVNSENEVALVTTIP